MSNGSGQIVIVDYGIGNLRSIEKAFVSVGAEVVRSDRREDIEQADRVVLPGVGAFGACAAEIRRRDLEVPVLAAIRAGKPFLGVCVGMQLLFEVGEELGTHRGLGVLPGRVVRIDGRWNSEAPERLKIPHMGWNTVEPRKTSPLLDGVHEGSYFYFVHSYVAIPAEPSDILSTSLYGVPFPAMVQRNNVFGVQFHPEKSQRNGLQILRNFAELT